MATHQMRTELVELMKKTVERFNISSETYYHAVLLFNVIQLKKNQEDHMEYYTIPIRKKELDWSSDSDQEDEQYEEEEFIEPEPQYITLHHSEMPEKDKLYLTVCLFLVHKLYQPYPLCLSYLMRQLEIDERFEEYIISLEKEFLVKLAYKIENMLPSNEAIFACHLWDQFIENISSSCVDIRFGIQELFECSKKKIRTSHQIEKAKIQPEFKTLQNQQTFEALSRNIQILVHNRAVYDLYVQKSAQQGHQDIPPMKKIGLAISYVTILQQTKMVFNKKFPFNQNENLNPQLKKTNFIQFVYNDFLEAHFGMTLDHLAEQVSIVSLVLDENPLSNPDKPQKKNNKFCSLKVLEEPESNSNKFIEFLLRARSKPTLREHHHKFHTKCKGNMSISSTKTDKQTEGMQFISKKLKCRSIFNNSPTINKHKNIQSTIHQSNLSEKADSLADQICTNKQKSIARSKISHKKKKLRSIQEMFSFTDLNSMSKAAHQIQIDLNKQVNSLINLDAIKVSDQENLKISHFVSEDI